MVNVAKATTVSDCVHEDQSSLVLFLRSNKIVLLNYTGSEHFGVKNNKLWAMFPISIVSLSAS